MSNEECVIVLIETDDCSLKLTRSIAIKTSIQKKSRREKTTKTKKKLIVKKLNKTQLKLFRKQTKSVSNHDG